TLEEKLGEGGFGEVWAARHETLKEKRVFKFCFRAERVRSLKREVTLFRLLKERIGEHPNIVRLHDVYFDEPPYYLMEEYVPGKDLGTWCKEQGGVSGRVGQSRVQEDDGGVPILADRHADVHGPGVIGGEECLDPIGHRFAESRAVRVAGGRPEASINHRLGQEDLRPVAKRGFG